MAIMIHLVLNIHVELSHLPSECQTLIIVPRSLYFGKWEKNYYDFDLGPVIPNVILVRDILIYHVIFKFYDPRSKHS